MYNPPPTLGTNENNSQRRNDYSASTRQQKRPPVGHKLWRPWSLRPTTLILFAVLCFGYIAAFEFTLRMSGTNALNDAPKWVTEVVPTIATVFLGMLFSVVQNDAARLEPYYQLSKSSGGATAHESLLVDYQRVFQLWVPIMAFRKRHWTVFVATCIQLVITFGATPLSSTVFSNGSTLITERHPVKMATLVPLEKQLEVLSPLFSYNAYERVWNITGVPFPPFAMDGFSVAPFEPSPEVMDQIEQADSHWHFQTTRYSAALDCVVPTQNITYRTTSKGEALDSIYLRYEDDQETCEYPLSTPFQSGNPLNLDTLNLDNRYPYNAILQDIRPRPGSEGRGSLESEVKGLHNTTKICGLQGEFEFLVLWRKWPLTQEELEISPGRQTPNKPLSLERLKTLLSDEMYELLGTFPNRTATALHVDGDDRGTFNTNQLPMPGTFTAVMCKPVFKQQAVNAKVNSAFELLGTKPLGEMKPLENVNTTLFSDILTARHQNFTRAFGLAKSATGKEGDLLLGVDNLESNLTLEDGSLFTVRQGRRTNGLAPSFTVFGMPDHKLQMRSSKKFTTYIPSARKFFQLSDDIVVNTLVSPEQSFLPFVLASASELQQLEDPKNIIAALSKSYSMLFNYTMSTGSYLEYTDDPRTTDGFIDRKRGYPVTTVSLLFTRLVQAVLALAAAMTLLFIVLIHKRPLHTVEEPGAIAWHMKSLANCPELVLQLDGIEMLPPADIIHRFKAENHLRYYLDPLHGGIEIVTDTPSFSPRPRLPRKEVEVLPETNSKAPRYKSPVELNVPLAVSLLVGLVATCGVLGVASQIGLDVHHPIIETVVFSYLPTVLGMLVEAYILMVTKFFGMIATYDDLHRGRRTSIEALKTNYENVPPTFLWFKALCNGNLLLAALSMSAILANVLAVSFSGLFQYQSFHSNRTEYINRSMNSAYGASFTPTMKVTDLAEYINISLERYDWDGEQNRFEDTRKMAFEDLYPPFGEKDPRHSMDLFYSVYRNLTSQGRLRPWTSSTTAFSPLQVETSDLYGENTLYDTTFGLASSLSCLAVPNTDVITGQKHPFDRRKMRTDWYVTPGHSPADRCGGATIHKSLNWQPDSEGQNEQEYRYSDILLPVSQRGCLGNFIHFWLREIAYEELPPSSNRTSNMTTDQLILNCSPTLQLRNYTIAVDRKGNIITSTRVPSTKELSDIVSDEDVRLLHSLFQTYIAAGVYQEEGDLGARSDPNPSTWLTLLLHLKNSALGSTFPPDPAVAVAAYQDVYPLLFSSFLSTYWNVLMPGNGDPQLEPVVITDIKYSLGVTRSLFVLAIFIMVAFCLVIGTVLVRRPGRFMTHLPTNIAAKLAMIYAGRWIADLKMQGWKDGKRGLDVEFKGAEGVKFGYGWFEGADGHWHIGIDKEPVERLEAGAGPTFSSTQTFTRWRRLRAE